MNNNLSLNHNVFKQSYIAYSNINLNRYIIRLIIMFQYQKQNLTKTNYNAHPPNNSRQTIPTPYRNKKKKISNVIDPQNNISEMINLHHH
jgi:hypothetical protein